MNIVPLLKVLQTDITTVKGAYVWSLLHNYFNILFSVPTIVDTSRLSAH